MREEKVMDNSFGGMLVFIFFMSATLFVFNFQEISGLGILSSYPFISFLSILVLLAGLYIIKVGALYVLQLIFEQRELFDEYVIILMNINIVVGIMFIPLNLLYQYGIALSSTTILFISLIIFTLSILLRYIRIYELGQRSNMKWYNIILYLCTLEILPVILIMTIVKNTGLNLNIGF
jgi:hypothetical protein